MEGLGFDDWPRSVLTFVGFCTLIRAPGLDAVPFNMEVPPARGDEVVEFAGGVGIGSEGGLSEDIMLDWGRGTCGGWAV
jgi:hypothetical protein